MTAIDRQRKRRTADERRVDVLNAALIEFATYGLHGASTVNIAARAGISQPYVLRLFGTKKNLFLEAVRMAGDMIDAQWSQALSVLPDDTPPQVRLHALGSAFQALTGRADVLRLLLQAYSAAADDEVRVQCQRAMAELYDWVRDSTGASMAETQAFFANGMLIMVGVSIGAPGEVDQEWARAFLLRNGNGASQR